MSALEFAGVSVRLGGRIVLDRVSFAVPGGSVCALLGPNGAGKTTTIRASLGLTGVDAGRIRVLGEYPPGHVRARARVGYAPDLPGIPAWMTGREYLASALAMTASPHEERIGPLLEAVSLDPDARVETYSRGMTQRLGLAAALIASPGLLIVDEPTSALDPEGRRLVLALLAELRRRTTVLVSSHQLGDMEEVADHAILLRSGRVRWSGAMSGLLAAGSERFYAASSDDALLASLLGKVDWADSVGRVEARGRVEFEADAEDAARFLPPLVARHDLRLYSYGPMTRTLDDAFSTMVEGAS